MFWLFFSIALWEILHSLLASIIVSLALTIYVLIGIFFEERKLLCEFGQAYADYKSRTPMLIPALKLSGNK